MNNESQENLLKLIEEQKKIIEEQQNQIKKLSSHNESNKKPTRELKGKENNMSQKREVKLSEQKKKRVSENLFGINILNYVSVVLIFLGFLYLLQYTLFSDWNEYLKTSIGYLSSLMILVFGLFKRLKSNNKLFGYAYTGLGLSMFYIVTFISCSSYELIPLTLALTISIVVTIIAILLAIKFRSQVVASLAIIGGYSSIIYVQWDGYSNINGFHIVSIILLILMYTFSLLSIIKYNWYETKYLSIIGHYIAFGTIIYLSDNFNLNLIVLSLFIVAHFFLINIQLLRNIREHNFNDYLYSILFSIAPIFISIYLFNVYENVAYYKWFLLAFGVVLYITRLSLKAINIKVCNYIYSALSFLYIIISVYMFVFNVFNNYYTSYNYKALYTSIIIIVIISALNRLVGMRFKHLEDIKNVSVFVYIYALIAGFFCTVFFIPRIHQDELILFLLMYLVYFGYYALLNYKKILQMKNDNRFMYSFDKVLLYLTKPAFYIFTMYSIILVVTIFTDNIYLSLDNFTSLYVYLGFLLLDIFVRRLEFVNDKFLSILVAVIFGIMIIINLINIITMPTSSYYILERISEGIKTAITIYYFSQIINVFKENKVIKSKYFNLLTSVYTTIIMWIYFANLIQWKYEGYLLESVILAIAFLNIYIGIKNKYKLMRVYGLILIYTVIIVYFIFDFGSMSQTEKILSTFTYGIILLVTTSIYFRATDKNKIESNIKN